MTSTVSRYAGVAVKSEEPRADPKKWFERAPGMPNKSEILYLALVVSSCGKTVPVLEEWANSIKLKALSDTDTIDMSTHELYWLIHDDYISNVFGDSSRLEHIGKAMQGWRGEGRFNGLEPEHLRRHHEVRPGRRIHVCQTVSPMCP